MICSHTNLVRDKAVDDVICLECGLVLREHQVPADWDDLPRPTQDAAITIQDSLPVNVVTGISSICSKMHLCDIIQAEAVRIAHETGLKKSLRPSLAACVYLACKNVNLSRTQSELEVGVNISPRALSRAVSRLVRKKGNAGRSPSDTVNEMIARTVSKFVTLCRTEVPAIKIEKYMRQIYKSRWKDALSGRCLTINTAIARCLLEAMARVSGAVSKEMKETIRSVCGVKTL